MPAFSVLTPFECLLAQLAQLILDPSLSDADFRSRVQDAVAPRTDPGYSVPQLEWLAPAAQERYRQVLGRLATESGDLRTVETVARLISAFLVGARTVAEQIDGGPFTESMQTTAIDHALAAHQQNGL